MYHISRLLKEYELSMEPNFDILLAIWFHDVIYDPKATGGQNEIQSADHLKKF